MGDLAEILTGDLLPEEIQATIAVRRELIRSRVDSIAMVVRGKREAAIRGRRASGIEAEWQRCEDQYEGVDDANRSDVRELKPANPDGALTYAGAQAPVRSTALLNITRPYTDAAASRMCDLLLPIDDRNWSLNKTPIPELSKALQDHRPIPDLPPTTDPLPTTEAQPNPQHVVGPDGQPVPRPMTPADLAAAQERKADEQAAAATRRIDDWLTQCDYHAEVRRVIHDMARLGTGCLKGPVPVRRKSKKVSRQDGVHSIEMVTSIDPESRWVSVWNCYPDPSCGTNIHHGSYFFERDDINGRRLRNLADVPGYNRKRIAEILKNGPERKYAEEEGTSQPRADGTDYDTEQDEYEIWYFYGDLDERDFETLGLDDEDVEGLFQERFLGDPCGKTIPVLVTLVNDVPIKVAKNPLDSGAFPYVMVTWQERPLSPWGYGVPWQIRVPQQIATAATRNLMDNAGLAGGPILVIDQSMVTPLDGDWTLTPRKIFTTLEGAIGKDVRTAFMSVNINMLQAELLNIVNWALKVAEDVTGLPMILQGQIGKAPDTVGGMQMLQNNASSLVRRLAKVFDDKITTVHIGFYYEWLLLYGPEDSEKGDFIIDARGSSALVERDIQNQTIAQMLSLSVNPIFGLSPARCMEEFLKSQRLDVTRFQPTEAEKQAMAQQQPAPPPQVQAAQINAQASLQREQMRQQTTQVKIKTDTDRDTAFVQTQIRKGELDHQADMQELAVKRELAMLEYANKRNISLDQIKAELATNAAKINLQRELAATPPAGAPQVATPPIEPPGRAPAGYAYQA